MKSHKRIYFWSLLGIYVAVPLQLLAQSVQGLGLPSPVELEVVFPQIVFGKGPAGNIISELVIVNPSDKSARVEVDLFGRRGVPPEILYQNDPFTRNTFKGAHRGSHGPNSIWTITYPPPNTGNLHDLGFSGWALVRSNEPVAVYQKIKVLDPDSGEVASELNVTGNSRPILSAEFPVNLNSGSPGRNTGIALVNPHDSKLLTLTVQLLDFKRQVVREKKVELRYRWQESFVASDFFGIQDTGTWFVRIKSETSDPFSFTALAFAQGRLFARRRDLFSFSLPGRIDGIRLEKQLFVEFADTPWNFPVPITGTATIRDLGILLTSMGYCLAAADGSKFGPFKFSAQFIPPVTYAGSGPPVFTSPQLGIAVIYSEGTEKAILFADKRKIVSELMHGEVVHIVEIPGKKQAEVKSSGLYSVGLTLFVASYLLIDLEKEEVIARFSGPSHLLPPWRQ